MRRSIARGGYPGAVLLATSFLASCVDGPSTPLTEDPVGRAPASVAATAGVATQSALVGQPVPVSPAVRVLDVRGEPVAGQVVVFAVTAGSGTVQFPSARTDAGGVAAAGQWHLGSVAGLNELSATVAGLPSVRFAATGRALEPSPAPPAPTPPTGALGTYDITVRYLVMPTARQQQAVSAAVHRWRSVITADLADIPVKTAAGSCLDSAPALNEVVDDMLLFVEFVAIDGPGKVLGEAGPCFIRSDTGLPVVGHLKLDVADLQQLEANGTLDDVVLHEIGHVLGIGTLWTNKSLLTGAGTMDPQFTGTQAHSAYRGMGGASIGVPVENTGGVGTRDGHWRESVFGNELMTGFVGRAPNPLSALTVASLVDLGYGANAGAASSYALGGSSGRTLADIDLHEHEVLLRPKYRIDRTGRPHPIR